MDINTFMRADLYSLQQTIGIANLQRAMGQSAQAVESIINTMQESTAKTMEMSVNPHLGSNIDVKL